MSADVLELIVAQLCARSLALPRGVTTRSSHPFTPMAGCGAPRACANRHSTAVANRLGVQPEQDNELMCLLAVLPQ